MNRRYAQWLVVVMIVAVGSAYAFATIMPKMPHVVPADQAALQAAETIAPYREKAWEYSVTVDPLIGDSTLHSKVMGSGPMPDSPPNASSLELTDSHQYGKSVTVAFPRVPEACQANPCTVRLSWDEAPPDQYRYEEVPSASADRTTLRLDDYGRFMEALPKAHQLKVMAAFGMQNDYVVTFPVDGFNPKRGDKEAAREPPTNIYAPDETPPPPMPGDTRFSGAPVLPVSQPGPEYIATPPAQSARRG